jgi:ribokinase
VNGARVLVLGNACLDLRLELPHLPRPGETLPGWNPSRAPGGKGLNQAVAAARAGAAVHFHAPIGRDAQGEEIAAALAREGFAALVLPRMPASTDYSLVMVLPDGENSITGAGSCAAALSDGTAQGFAATANAGDILLLQGNLSASATEAAMHAARAAGARILFNPAPLWWNARPLLGLCDIVVVNRGEAAMLSGEAQAEEAAAALRTRGAGIVIVTLGAEGCLVADHAGMRHHAGIAVRAIDTTGCGDAFCGTLAALLARGAALADAVRAAQEAAALTATRAGACTALPARAELDAIIGALQ